VRPHGKTKLGFFPLPLAEAERLRNYLAFSDEFSALDPCVGDGVAFAICLTVPRHTATESRSMLTGQSRQETWGPKLCRQTRWTCGVQRRRCHCCTSILPMIGRPVLRTTKTRSCLCGPHLSLAQAGWRPALCHSSAAARELRKAAERGVSRPARFQVDRIGVPSVQADRCRRNARAAPNPCASI
jgi:hypothetical protein